MLNKHTRNMADTHYRRHLLDEFSAPTTTVSSDYKHTCTHTHTYTHTHTCTHTHTRTHTHTHTYTHTHTHTRTHTHTYTHTHTRTRTHTHTHVRTHTHTHNTHTHTCTHTHTHNTHTHTHTHTIIHMHIYTTTTTSASCKVHQCVYALVSCCFSHTTGVSYRVLLCILPPSNHALLQTGKKLFFLKWRMDAAIPFSAVYFAILDLLSGVIFS